MPMFYSLAGLHDLAAVRAAPPGRGSVRRVYWRRARTYFLMWAALLALAILAATVGEAIAGLLWPVLPAPLMKVVTTVLQIGVSPEAAYKAVLEDKHMILIIAVLRVLSGAAIAALELLLPRRTRDERGLVLVALGVAVLLWPARHDKIFPWTTWGSDDGIGEALAASAPAALRPLLPPFAAHVVSEVWKSVLLRITRFAPYYIITSHLLGGDWPRNSTDHQRRSALAAVALGVVVVSGAVASNFAVEGKRVRAVEVMHWSTTSGAAEAGAAVVACAKVAVFLFSSGMIEALGTLSPRSSVARGVTTVSQRSLLALLTHQYVLRFFIILDVSELMRAVGLPERFAGATGGGFTLFDLAVGRRGWAAPVLAWLPGPLRVLMFGAVVQQIASGAFFDWRVGGKGSGRLLPALAGRRGERGGVRRRWGAWISTVFSRRRRVRKLV